MIKRLRSKGSKQCSETEFECSPGRCIPKTWLCDLQHDCTDGLDEKNCRSKLSISRRLIAGTSQEGAKEKRNEKEKAIKEERKKIKEKLRNISDRRGLSTVE